MRFPMRLARLALLALPLFAAGCELTPDLGSSEMRLREGQSTLDDLLQRMEKCRTAKEDYEAALKAGDEGASRAARRSLMTAQGKMKDKMAFVQARKPEFPDRGLQARFVDEVRQPWSILTREVDDLLAGRTKAPEPPEEAPAPGK